MSLLASLIAPLFVPADRPERFAKAATSGADAVIIDLEDAVPAADKASARDQLRDAALDVPVIVRINGAATPWHQDDVAALDGLDIAAIILPKAEREQEGASLAAIAPVIALVETARGLANVRALAQSGAFARLAFGSIDFAADIGCDHLPEALLAARSELVLASRLGALPPPLDGVTTDISNPAATRDDARAARSLGFGGKLLIHPRQVAAVFEGFLPTPEEVEWARQVLAADEEGAVKIGEQMVDAPVRIRARALLSRSEAGGAVIA
ncbi:HpcH/HpaI aldolase/citrate lyase family protein [Rhizorhabdus phycosphaerae]|uniref:HpcH/HpaI aldolase/citrate lyase family protein n=1 Tax=Rhizorhabdus phycosphaerae TaxID=2711156 RepID=UPI0013EB772F|nr:CoA ester lyase [Rhizorhabdus phycosphaerae]